jgi:Fic family protein
MFEPKFTISNSITKALLEIERARGFLDAAKLKEVWIQDMQSEALILEAHHSTHIEGTQLTFAQAQGILTGKSVKGVRADDRQELLNYQKICNTIKRTATRDLTDLVNFGLLERHGEKKGTYYTPKLFE